MALEKDSQLRQMAGEKQRPSAHTTEPRALPTARAVALEDLLSPSSLEKTTDPPAPRLSFYARARHQRVHLIPDPRD